MPDLKPQGQLWPGEGTPKLRNPDKVEVFPWREWGRQYLPKPQEGMVLEDIDLVVLRFGPLEGRPYSADGRFLLAEIKQGGGGKLEYAQERVFGLLHRLLRKSDPTKQYYVGFYLIQWGEVGAIVNGRKLTWVQLRDFMLGKLSIPSLWS